MEKKKLLIVDDERDFAEMMKINLEKTDSYEVDTAFSAMECFEKIKIKTYDLIFLDVLMPKIEGIEALQTVHEKCETPVIIMSAYLPPTKQRVILNQGAADFLEKPFNLEKALQVIHRVFAAKEAEKGREAE